ncbi:MAG: response regulator transcription factor [bacterium]
MKKILFVEDDSSLYRMYSTELELRGYQVVWESNGGKAFSKAESESPDLILLDIMLPEMDGITILQKLKASDTTKDIPVFVLTNFGDEENIKKVLEGGAEDFILKYKIVPSELAQKLDSFFNVDSSKGVSIT